MHAKIKKIAPKNKCSEIALPERNAICGTVTLFIPIPVNKMANVSTKSSKSRMYEIRVFTGVPFLKAIFVTAKIRFLLIAK